jgi:plasmid stabilization system protein ParE
VRDLLWTEQAVTDLAAIHAFISQDSPHYATVVVRQLIAAVDQLTTFENVSPRRVERSYRAQVR